MRRVTKCVKDKALVKWRRALESCIDQHTFYSWWDEEGQNLCSFCHYFEGKPCKRLCPIHSGDSCAQEWRDLLGIFGLNYSPSTSVDMVEVTGLVQSMLSRIQAVEIFSKKVNIVNK